jgi:hypothetical protein
VVPLEKVREKFTKSVILSIDLKAVQENTIGELRNLMEKNKGNCPCYFNVTDVSSRRMFQAKRFTVDPSGKFVDEARKMLGPDGVRLVAANGASEGRG